MKVLVICSSLDVVPYSFSIQLYFFKILIEGKLRADVIGKFSREKQYRGISG
jgi:hypothetical protein